MMDAGGDAQESTVTQSRLTVDEVDCDFLPIIYEIIKGLERDFHESSQKPSQTQDLSHKVIELQKKLDTAREQVKRLPGVEYSKEEQLNKLEALRKQLRVKQELLLKLLSNERVISKLADSAPIRRAARWAVYFMNRFKAIAADEALMKQQLEKSKNLSSYVEGRLKQIKEELERKLKQ